MLSRRLLRIKVIKALYAHFKSESDSLLVSEKNLLSSVNKTYDLYHQLLWIIVEVMRLAESRIELGKNKKLPSKEDLNPNTRFIDNRLIRQIESDDDLLSYLEKKGLGWVKHPELIKSLYNSLLESDYYKQYMSAAKNSYKDDVRLVEDFFLNEIEDNPLVEETIEEQSILWSDDLDFALIMVIRTLTSARSNEKLPLLDQYKSADDKEFLLELFRRTLVGYNEYIPYIENNTQNWDLDRIAFMDNLIMATAIAELVTFPSIPVKVTLDEYIEIAKYYSTQGSSVFINGVLDKVITVMTNEGKIKKTGRGLL